MHKEHAEETHRNKNKQANAKNSVRSETCSENNYNTQKNKIQYNLAKVLKGVSKITRKKYHSVMMLFYQL